jgi:hypothetical protein
MGNSLVCLLLRGWTSDVFVRELAIDLYARRGVKLGSTRRELRTLNVLEKLVVCLHTCSYAQYHHKLFSDSCLMYR